MWWQPSDELRRTLTNTQGGRSSGHDALRVCCWQYCQLSILSYTAPPPAPHPANRHVGWDMRPSKVMSYTGFLCATVPANAQFLRAPPMQACPPRGQPAQVCSKPSVCCRGARWMPLQGLWGLNSSCVRDDSMYESSRLFPLIHSIKLS